MADAKPGETITPQGPATDDKSPRDTQKHTETSNLDDNVPQNSWSYAEENGGDTQDRTMPYGADTQQDVVTWTASEFIAHEKTPGWYVMLALVGCVATGAIYILTKDEITAGMVLFVALMFGFVAGRKPRVLDYRIGPEGISIGQKLYLYQVLKSFSIQQEGGVNSVVLLPMRRFMPAITLYYPPDQEDDVLETLGTYLPMEERSGDAIDRFMRKIRF